MIIHRKMSFALFALILAVSALAINPVIPSTGIFMCDPEAHVWPNDTNTLYVYGSHDSLNDVAAWGCTNNLHVFSTTDLVNWVDHGAVLNSSGTHDDVPWTNEIFYAPDCACKNGTWYLYFPFANLADEGVATAASPGGPFSNSVKSGAGTGIDPAVFVDDDGQAYLYWDQSSPWAAKLKSTMLSIDSSTIVNGILPGSNSAPFYFCEASSMRKRNGIYYYVYAGSQRHAGHDNVLAYGTSTSPLGPFTYRGIIIDNYGSDPGVSNNHGSIAQFHGKWYVFYHRSSRNTVRNRRLCIEPITFNADGTIPEVSMTSQGVSGPIDACSRIEAEIACGLSGTAYIETSSDTGIGIGNIQEHIGFIQNNNYAIYRYLDFGTGTDRFSARIACPTSNSGIEIRLDSITGTLIGTCPVQNTGSFQTWGQTVSTPITVTTGIHAVYLKFTGGSGYLFNLNWFAFSRTTAVQPTAKNRTMSPAGNKMVEIYDLRGKLISTYRCTNERAGADRSNGHLSEGLYIQRITQQGQPAGKQGKTQVIKAQ